MLSENNKRVENAYIPILSLVMVLHFLPVLVLLWSLLLLILVQGFGFVVDGSLFFLAQEIA